MPTKSSNHSFAHLFSGVDAAVPLLNGDKRKYVNLDNAASTPVFKTVQGVVNNFFTYYSSVHRGTGFRVKFPHMPMRSPGKQYYNLSVQTLKRIYVYSLRIQQKQSIN